MAVKTQVAKITKTTVDKMQPGDVLQDTELKGFRVRCQGQSKSFAVYYRIYGRQRWFTLGRFGVLTVEQARQKAREVLGLVASGKDPAASKEAHRKAPSIKECAELYQSNQVDVRLKPVTRRFYKAVLEQTIIPKLGSLQMKALTRQDVARLHDSLRKTPAYANRTLAVLSAMCNWAEKRGYREENSNPCRLIDKYKETARERYLSDAELSKLAVALKEAETGADKLEELRAKAKTLGKRLSNAERPDLQASPMAVAAVRLLLFTGACHNEIVTAKWDYVDFEKGLLRLPDSKTGAKAIVLSAPALQVLQSISRIKGNPYIIAGEVAGQPLRGLQKIWERIRNKAKLSDVRLHDLRHSYASMAVGAGYSLAITGKLLGHTQAATTQRYAHLADDPLRKATEAVGSRISSIMETQPAAAIVQLKPRRK